MRIVPVDLGKNSYDIIIGRDLGKEIISFCQDRAFSKKTLIITDENVGREYGKKLQHILGEAGLEAFIYEIKPGESSKSLAVAEELFTKCIELGLDRKSPIFALGGGVVGDLAGFVAASYMRGVPFIQVPTSLLAQVDSSVGGKVAVNHSLGKNLIGAFYQPQGVFIDLDTLGTLPAREISTGLGEIVKYGLIYDKDLFSYLEEYAREILSLEDEVIEHIIARSCEIKALVVSQDERELGLRAILNFGHTAAHAIEKNTGYTKYNHGEAVAIGMMCAAYISQSLGLISEEVVVRICNLIKKLGLPYKAEDCNAEALYRDTFHDKKTIGGKVKWILLSEIGKVIISNQVKDEEALKALEKCLN